MQIELAPYTQRVLKGGYRLYESRNPNRGTYLVPNDLNSWETNDLLITNPIDILRVLLDIPEDSVSQLEEFTNIFGLLTKVDVSEVGIAEELGIKHYSICPISLDYNTKCVHRVRSLIESNSIHAAYGTFASLFNANIHRRSFILGIFEVGYSDQTKQAPHLIYKAPNLLSYLEAYAAHQLISGHKFAICEHCYQIFLQKEGRGQKAKYCGGACRVAAHRERRE